MEQQYLKHLMLAELLVKCNVWMKDYPAAVSSRGCSASYVVLMFRFVTPSLMGGVCFGAGLGITLFGIMYMFIHDGMVHRRFPVRPALLRSIVIHTHMFIHRWAVHRGIPVMLTST